MDEAFDDLQRRRLLDGWRADQPGATTPALIIALPSYSVDRAVYEHYGDRVPPLENRFLHALMRWRHPASESKAGEALGERRHPRTEGRRCARIASGPERSTADRHVG
jgi:hypothetical protein